MSEGLKTGDIIDVQGWPWEIGEIRYLEKVEKGWDSISITENLPALCCKYSKMGCSSNLAGLVSEFDGLPKYVKANEHRREVLREVEEAMQSSTVWWGNNTESAHILKEETLAKLKEMQEKDE